MMVKVMVVGVFDVSKQMHVLHNMAVVVKNLVGGEGKGEAAAISEICLVLLRGLMADSGEATVVIFSFVEAKRLEETGRKALLKAFRVPL